MSKPNLTICTVDYSSADVLAMNISHTKKLNKSSGHTWSIVTNDVTGVQNGYTLVYDGTSGNWEAQPAAEIQGSITNLDGGTF